MVYAHREASHTSSPLDLQPSHATRAVWRDGTKTTQGTRTPHPAADQPTPNGSHVSYVLNISYSDSLTVFAVLAEHLPWCSLTLGVSTETRVTELGLEPRLFASKARRVADYTTP